MLYDIHNYSLLGIGVSVTEVISCEIVVVAGGSFVVGAAVNGKRVVSRFKATTSKNVTTCFITLNKNTFYSNQSTKIFVYCRKKSLLTRTQEGCTVEIKKCKE